MKTIEAKRSKKLNNQTTQAENIYLIVAGIFMITGFFAPLLGIILVIVHAAVAEDVVFNRAATILFVVSIPLLFIGSHFMDIHRDRRRMRKRKELQRKTNF